MNINETQRNLIKQKQFLIEGYRNSSLSKQKQKSASSSSSKINSPTYDNAIDIRQLDTPLPKGVDYTKLKIERSIYRTSKPMKYDNLNEINKNYLKETFFLPVENPELNVNLNNTLFKNNYFYKQIKFNFIKMIIKLTNYFVKYRYILDLFNKLFDTYDNAYMNVNNIMNFYINLNYIINNSDVINLFKIYEENEKYYIHYYRSIFNNTNILIAIILNYLLKNTLINPINKIENDETNLVLNLFYYKINIDNFNVYRLYIFNRNEIKVNPYVLNMFDIHFFKSFYKNMLKYIKINYSLIFNSRSNIYKFIINNALQSLHNTLSLRTLRSSLQRISPRSSLRNSLRTSLRTSLRNIPRSGGKK